MYKLRLIIIFFKKAKRYGKSLYCRFYDDEIPALGAQTAYYLILSFFPFLIFLMTLLGYSPISSDEVLKVLVRVLPQNAYSLIENNVQVVLDSRKSGLLSLGFVASLWAASNGMGAVIRGLNKAYDVEEVRPFWKVKGESLIFTIALAFTILLSFILLIFGKTIGIYLTQWLGLTDYFLGIWNRLRVIIMLAFMVLIFLALYFYAPNYRLKWRDVIVGSVFSTFGWLITSLGFAYYVNNFANFSRVYGGIGGIIVLLVWLFISSMIILIGGEINAVFWFEREGKEKIRAKRY